MCTYIQSVYTVYFLTVCLLCTYIKSTSSVHIYSLCTYLQSALTLYLFTDYLLCTNIQSTLLCVLTLYLQIIYLGLGDTLHLQTGSSYFTGDLFWLTFCASLTAFDYCILDGSCVVL